MIKIALFASGSGTNVENIIRYFRDSKLVKVSKVYSNNAKAGVLDKCKKLGVESVVFTKDDFFLSDLILIDVKKSCDIIVLAGFLWKVPENIIKEFSNKIINIHPSLLPKYGGKGMYGMNVHKAVKENKEAQSGITIHFVNEHYDKGQIIFQASIAVLDSDSAEDIAAKIHLLEYEHFPRVIEETILNNG